MTNWQHPRKKLISAAADAYQRGWGSIGELAESAVRRHYMGKSPDRALRLFVRDLYREVVRRGDPEFRQMVETLHAEGWEYLPMDGVGMRGIFFHRPTGNQVNRMGGPFDSFEEAVKATYYSATRELLQEGNR